MKGMHGKSKIILQIFEASFHAARMLLTVKTLRITIKPKENRYCSTNYQEHILLIKLIDKVAISYTSFYHIDTIFSK